MEKDNQEKNNRGLKENIDNHILYSNFNIENNFNKFLENDNNHLSSINKIDSNVRIKKLSSLQNLNTAYENSFFNNTHNQFPNINENAFGYRILFDAFNENFNNKKYNINHKDNKLNQNYIEGK